MDALNRLQLHIMQDEMSDRWNNFRQRVTSFFTRHQSRIGVSLAESSHDAEGRVWVEVGRENLHLRVTHLHPANPSVSEALRRKCKERREAKATFLTGKLIYPPEDDKISLSSLEDYWFNHWQGPFITAGGGGGGNTQNSCSLSKLRRSHRKSKRSNRCSICQKKLAGVRAEAEERASSDEEPASLVLAHMPSLIKSACSMSRRGGGKEDGGGGGEERSEDDEEAAAHGSGGGKVINEDALSRLSGGGSEDPSSYASPSPLAPPPPRVHRVLDHELRTSVSLFADEAAVSPDVVDDAAVSMDTSDHPQQASPAPPGGNLPPGGLLSAPLPLPRRQSRSCPCSPKLSSRASCSSPESISNSSPKSRSSFLGAGGGAGGGGGHSSSKFSLSSSLLALHRQASTSLGVPEFFFLLKGDSSKGGDSSSQHNSLNSETRARVRHTLSEASFQEEVSASEQAGATGGSGAPLEEEGVDVTGGGGGGAVATTPTKRAVTETQSLPPLKLSKMSLTYRGGVVIISEEEGEGEGGREGKGGGEREEEGRGGGGRTSSHLLPRETTISASQQDPPGLSPVLPDVVPMQKKAKKKDGAYEDPLLKGAGGGGGGVVNLGFDGMGESSDFEGDETESDVATSSRTKFDHTRDAIFHLSAASSCDVGQQHHQSPVACINDMLTRESLSGNLSCAAFEPLSRDDSLLNKRPPSSSSSPTAHPPLTRRGPPPEGGKAPDGGRGDYRTRMEEEEEEEVDVMAEAREMVFWWRAKKGGGEEEEEEEEEFCLHETECKVKQKPVLMFLHGIGSSADVWNQQLWYFLSCGYEVVAPDLLGHGLSSAPRDKTYYSFAQMLDYVSLVFDLFVPRGRKCVVVGHNYGCSLAVALARGRPLSVSLIVLASCGGPSPLVPRDAKTGPQRRGRTRKGGRGAAPLPASLSSSSSSSSAMLTRLLNPFISCGCLSRELLYYPRGKHYPPVPRVPSTPRYVVEFTSRGQKWAEGDLSFHRRITIPALLLHGMKDDRVSFIEMCEMEKTIPRAFLELIPGAGHELMTDCAEEVCHAMHRFVRRWKHKI